MPESPAVFGLQNIADHAGNSAGRRLSEFRGGHDRRADQVSRIPGKLVSAHIFYAPLGASMSSVAFV